LFFVKIDLSLWSNQKNKIMKFASTDNLDWKVRQEPVQTQSGIIIPGQMAIVREDTNVPLSIMAETYQPYQNHELIELLERVSNQTGMEIKKSGLFGNGEKVFIQLKSNDLKLGNDRVEGYLTGINSFDGSTSLAFGPSNVTISCTNSFFAAFRGLNTKVRHTKNMVLRIDDICRGLEGVLEEEKQMFDNIVKMSETRISGTNVDDVLRQLFNIKKEVNLKDAEAISNVTRNKIDRFYVDMNGELQEKGDNLWGLFSGVTKYTTHSLSKTDNTEKKMFGVYGNREREIFNGLVELV
jgi:phage/plasmid-like protein (TIGR03299 family)